MRPVDVLVLVDALVLVETGQVVLRGAVDQANASASIIVSQLLLLAGPQLSFRDLPNLVLQQV